MFESFAISTIIPAAAIGATIVAFFFAWMSAALKH
jgi:hypothetical protein